MRVLLAVVSPRGTATVGFAISLLRLQSALQTAPNMKTVIEMAPSVHDALKAAVAAEEPYDAVVAIKSHLSFPSSFVLRGLVSPAQFVTAVHPLPVIDWERVKAKAGGTSEATRFTGNVYNIDPKAFKLVPDAHGFVEVPHGELGGVVLKGEAIAAVAASAGGSDKELCGAWSGKIHADLDSQCALTGSVEFTGCVGMRSVVR